ncbi:MAG: hypothetical protein RSC00_01400 [Ruthenibacterium sp.]
MKQHSAFYPGTLIRCLAACLAIAACFALPRALLRRTDAALLQNPQPRSAAEDLLSAAGRENLLASMLYAQAHFLTGSETVFAAPGVPTQETVLADSIRALQSANVLPAALPLPDKTVYKAESGLLVRYYTEYSAGVQLEPATGKVVSFAWQGDALDRDLALQNYLVYLALDSFSWQAVDRPAQGAAASAVYSPDLQLYLSVTCDTRTVPACNTLNVCSMLPQQLSQIAAP